MRAERKWIAGLLGVAAFCVAGIAGTPKAEAQSFWGVNCGGTANGLDCRTLQVLPIGEGGGQLTLAVRRTADTRKPVMMLLAPLGIYLPAGIALKFGQAEAKAAAFTNCDSSGCLAEYPISDAELKALLDGQALTVWVQDMQRRPIASQVPGAGFPAAWAMLK